ncbi:MAG: CRISPR-associated endonuclease Cas2, partial [Proteobacteria bacterium]|nr:CRISPR-associated endonuclease Cas2 [Pseudomonadota bacterium]
MYIVLVYDVDQKRCGKMLKLCRRYLAHIQNSVFEGEITEGKLEALKVDAKDIMKNE